MKKTLVALATLALSTGVMAQSSVSIYGIADLAVHKDSGVSSKMVSGGISTSRWGLMGSEDLGGGLSANFNFEQGLDMETGALKGNGFDRQAWLGLSGGFGEVKFGKAWNAFDDIAGVANPVFDSVVLSTAAIAPSYGYIGNPNSGVYYATPSMGGFSAAVSSSFKDAENDDIRVTAFNLSYENGPLFVAVGQERQKTTETVKYTRLLGTYDLGVAKLMAVVGKVTDQADDVTVGVDVPVGANMVVSAGYTLVRPEVGENANSFGIGLAYNLSKRTTVYTGYRKDNKEAVDNFDGVKSRFAVGVKHTF